MIDFNAKLMPGTLVRHVRKGDEYLIVHTGAMKNGEGAPWVPSIVYCKKEDLFEKRGVDPNYVVPIYTRDRETFCRKFELTGGQAE